MPCSRSNSELTLIFDPLEFRPSSQQFEFLRSQLLTVEGVISVEFHTPWRLQQQFTAVIQSDIPPEVMLRKMASALRGCGRSSAPEEDATAEEIPHKPQSADTESEPAGSERPENAVLQYRIRVVFSAKQPGSASTLRQRFYGTLAAASFAMAWVGLLVPGIPTVPFVLLTAHLAVKSSPRFRQKLLSSRTFGPMMRDWHDHRAIRRGVRTRAYVFTLILVCVTLLLTPISAVLYVVIVVMASLGFVLISRIPVIDDTTPPSAESPSSTEVPRLATKHT